MSVYADKDKGAMKKKGKKMVSDNKDVIANVAYENREVIGNAYLESQNHKTNGGY